MAKSNDHIKVAFMVTIFPALSETFILNQVTGLIVRGHHVRIFAKRPGDFPKTHADVMKYNVLESTYYFPNKYMPRNKIFRVIKAVGLLMANFHKNPIALLNSLNFAKFGRDASSLSMFFKIIPFVKNDLHKDDIVHCHFGENGVLAAFLKDIGVIKGKLITTFHGFDISKTINIEGKDIYDHLFKTGDLFQPISEKWKTELIKLGCGEEKITVHRMGIDTKKFAFLSKSVQKKKKVQILTIARLVEKKGVEYGIRAVGKMIETYSQIEYKIVGDGPLKTDLESLISALKLNRNVQLLGWKQQKEVIELLKETDILLAPSITSEDGDQEGIPVVLMEAMAIGLPIVSTQHSGIPELIEDGVSGFLVPERDVEALFDRVTYLVEHREIWPKMGQDARNYVENHYDINKLNDKLVGIYANLLKNSENY